MPCAAVRHKFLPSSLPQSWYPVCQTWVVRIKLFVFLPSLHLTFFHIRSKIPPRLVLCVSPPLLCARARVCVSTLFYALSVTVSERNKAFHSNQPELYRLFTRGVPYHPVYSSASEIYASNIKFDIVIFQEGGIMTTAALNRHCCGNNF